MSQSRELAASGVDSRALAALGERSIATTDRLDLSESVNFFRRRWRLIAAIAGVVTLIGIGITLFMDKTYTAQATVMLTNDRNESVARRADAGLQPAITGELVNTQVEVINSREMAQRVANALGLEKGLSASQHRELIDELQRSVSAERIGDSFVLAISYDTPDRRAAAARVNEYAKQFANWELKADQTRNAEATKTVRQRLIALREQAQADTQSLQQYRIANNLLSTSGASLTEQEISTYNQEVSRARAEAAEDEARLRTALGQLRSGSAGDDVGEALGSPVIASLRLEEAQTAGAVASLAAKYGPNHPQLIRAQGQLGEIRRRIDAEIGRVISNLRAKQAVSSQRLASLNQSLSSARGMLSQNNAAMVGLSQLERAAAASQGIYETYLNRYKELLASDGSERSNARVLTLADVPLTPRSPNLLLNLALSVMIGLGLGILVAYIAEALFHGITTSDEIERDLGERYLASVPLLSSVDSKRPHAVTAIQENPQSVFTESFRVLSASINQAIPKGAQVIAVTSALPGEGKTVISCCLSHVLAAEGLRTMLIDCDLRRGGISRLLEMEPDHKGLIEVLDKRTILNLDELTGDHVFCVLPLSPGGNRPEHLLTGQPFIDLLAELRQRFDRIVLDLPPMLPIAATRVLASRADAVVMATQWRKTTSFALRAALNRLPRDRANLAGIVLSQVDMRQRGFFNHDDPAYYYPQYREYYS